MLLEDGYSVMLCANDDYKMDVLIDHPKADFSFIDLRRMDRVKRVVKKSAAKVVINCAIDDFNLKVNKMALEIGMNYLDLGAAEDHMLYEQMALDKGFKEKNITGITGMGSTPGINNIMLRYVEPRFDTIHTVHLGFAWNSNIPKFVTPFSIDAIAYEFGEPAKILENGKFVEKNPYECEENFYYRVIGKQKTQFTKHIEHHSFYEYLKNKGIKNVVVFSSFPPHSHTALTALLNLGFMSTNAVQVDGVSVKPLDFTTEILRRIPVPEGYTEKENLWLKVYGAKDGKDYKVEMDCMAGTLPGWEEHTCNVDTGFPVAIAAEMIADGRISEKGLFSPENVVPPEEFFKELAKRKLYVYEDGKKIN